MATLKELSKAYMNLSEEDRRTVNEAAIGTAQIAIESMEIIGSAFSGLYDKYNRHKMQKAAINKNAEIEMQKEKIKSWQSRMQSFLVMINTIPIDKPIAVEILEKQNDKLEKLFEEA